jgi:FlaA1/EpsC-like NDP-sugar epimerase
VTLSIVDLPIGTLVGGLFLVLLAILATYLGRMHVYSANEQNAGSRVTLLVSDLLYKKRALELLLDVVLFGLAYHVAYVIRWDAEIPVAQRIIMERSLALVIAVHVCSYGIMGVYRGVWKQAGLTDFHRVIKASLLAGVATTAAIAIVFRETEFARSIPALTALIAAVLTAGARMSFRSLDRLRRGLGHDGRNTLLYGAGAAGALISRELLENRRLGLKPVGFVDDDPNLHGRIVNGVPVLGGSESLAALLLRSGAQTVLLCTRGIEADRLTRIGAVCSNGGVELLRFKLELQPVTADQRTAPAPSMVANTRGPRLAIE